MHKQFSQTQKTRCIQAKAVQPRKNFTRIEELDKFGERKKSAVSKLRINEYSVLPIVVSL